MEETNDDVNKPLALPNCCNCGHRQMRHSSREHKGEERFPCEACDCTDYGRTPGVGEPKPDPLDDPNSRQSIEHELYPKLKAWAHSYNGYERIMGDKLFQLLEPLMEEAGKTGAIPDRVGVDLLRGWAFYVARSHNNACMNDGSYSCCNVIYYLAEAVQNHKAVTKGDLPPTVPEILLKRASPQSRR